MALWTNPDKKSGLQRVATIDFGGGVNNGITPPHLIADNQSPAMLNIAPYLLPALTPTYPPVILGAFPGAVLMMGFTGSNFECIAKNGVSTAVQFEYTGAGGWVQKSLSDLTGIFFSCCNFMGQFLYSSVAVCLPLLKYPHHRQLQH